LDDRVCSSEIQATALKMMALAAGLNYIKLWNSGMVERWNNGF
jgi:hypothetical protein